MTLCPTPARVSRGRGRFAALSAAVLAATLLVTGCTEEQDGTTDADPDAQPSASAEATEDTTPVLTREECVVGTWQIDNAAFERFLNRLAPAGGVQVSVSGGSFLRFDDAGTFFAWREDFTIATSAHGATMAHVSNSGETGDYGLVLDWGPDGGDDFLWIAETMEVMRHEVMTVDGVATFIDEGGAEATIELFDGYTGQVPHIEGREAVEGSVPFTCDAEHLTVEYDVGSLMLYHRVASTT